MLGPPERQIRLEPTLNTVTPEDVGLSSSRLEHLKNVMQGYVDRGQVAGLSTLIARRGKVAHFECYGQMDVETNTAMQPDTIFRMASMTKPIVTVALLMLFEEGRFTLLDPVSKFIPSFAKLKVLKQTSDGEHALVAIEREITIQDLLRHTAGLIDDELEASSPVAELYKQAGFFGSLPSGVLQMPLADMVETLAEIPLAYQPGQKWSYGVSTDVVGYLVGLIADQALDTFLKEKIFEPLGMVDTAYYVPSEKLGRLSSLYAYREDEGLTLVESAKTSLRADPNRHPCGSMGLVSTMPDYFNFAQMLLNRGQLDGVRILSPKTVDLMTTNHLSDALLPMWLGDWFPIPGQGFGLGVRVLREAAEACTLDSEGTFGWGGIFGTGFRIDPREEMVYLIMRQLDHLSPVNVADIFSGLSCTAIEA